MGLMSLIKEKAVDNEVKAAAGPAEESVEWAAEAIERPYTLRRFKDGDLFLLLNILKKIGIAEIKKAFLDNVTKKTEETEETEETAYISADMNTAFAVADVLINNLVKVEEEIYSLYADMAGMTVEELKNMEFGTLPLMIVDSFMDVKNTSFFKVLSRFF